MDNQLQTYIDKFEYSIATSDINEQLISLSGCLFSKYYDNKRDVFKTVSHALIAFSDKLYSLIRDKHNTDEMADSILRMDLIPALERIKIQYEHDEEYTQSKTKAKSIIIQYLNLYKKLPNTSIIQLRCDIKDIKDLIKTKFNKENDHRRLHIDILVKQIKEMYLERNTIDKLMKLGEDICALDPSDSAKNLVSCCQEISNRHDNTYSTIRSFSERLRNELQLKNVIDCNSDADEDIKSETNCRFDLDFATERIYINADSEASEILHSFSISNDKLCDWTKIYAIYRIIQLCKFNEKTNITLVANKLRPYYTETIDNISKTPNDECAVKFINKINKYFKI